VADRATGAVPNTLVLQSTTTMRFTLFVMAMLATGLFIGAEMFAAVHRAEFAVCLQPGAGADLSSRAASMSGCWDLFRIQGTSSAVGAASVALGSFVVVAIAPSVIVRRRSLRPLGSALEPARGRVLSLCAETGVRRPPRLMVGPFGQRDAFCFGLPGRYAMALPPALAIRPGTTLFDAIVRHELAHIRHHDVTFAWLARSAWYVLAPLLLVPLVLFVLTGDHELLAGYLWRAAMFALVIELAARWALRAREHAADIHAATPTGTDAYQSVLAAVRGPISGWRRALAVHPSAAERISVVRTPGSLAAVTPADGAVVAFLVGFVLPSFDVLFGVMFAQSTQDLGVFVGTLLLGSAVAATSFGIGLWRQALVRRVVAVPVRLASVSAAVVVGAVVGQFASLARVELGANVSNNHPAAMLVIAGVLTGATVLTAGAGEVWAQAPPRVGGRLGYLAAAVVVSTVLIGLALWAGDVVQNVLDFTGWGYAAVSLLEEIATPAVLAVGLIPAAAIAWALATARHGGRYPQWLVNQSAPAPRPDLRLRHVLMAGVAAGLTGAAVIVAYRVSIGDQIDPLGPMHRIYGYWVMAAASGAAGAMALAIAGGLRGWGGALLASPLASAIAGAGTVAMLVVINGHLPAERVVQTLTVSVALGWVLTLLVAAFPLTVTADRPPSTAVLVLTAVLVSGAATTAVALNRDTILSPVLALAAAAPPSGSIAATKENPP
jgi:hypothetical protein